MCDNENLSEKLLNGYERLHPSIPASLSNVSTSLNLAIVVSLLMLTYFTLFVSRTAKRGLLSMTSDSLLGKQIIKSKIYPSFRQIAFFYKCIPLLFHCI